MAAAIDGLDFVTEFLDEAGARIEQAAAPPGAEVVYVPVRGRFERLDEAQVRDIGGDAGLPTASVELLFGARSASSDRVAALEIATFAGCLGASSSRVIRIRRQANCEGRLSRPSRSYGSFRAHSGG